MNGIVHVNIKTNKHVFDFDLEHKYTLLVGLSSTCKTLLCNLVSSVNVIKSPSKTLIHYRASDWELGTEFKNDLIYFIDETDFTLTDKFSKLSKLVNSKFVIINRDVCPNLNVRIDAIKEIHSEGNYHTLINILEKGRF